MQNKFQDAALRTIRDFMSMKPYTSSTPIDVIRKDVMRARQMLKLVRPFLAERDGAVFSLEEVEEVLRDWKDYHWSLVEAACLAAPMEFFWTIVTVLAIDETEDDDFTAATPVRTNFIRDFLAVYHEADFYHRLSSLRATDG